jgi:uncharacterized Fe-S cluster protein YjdI
MTRDPMRLQVYEGDGFAVSFDPRVCTHSGKCVRGLPAVFDVTRRKWIEPAAAGAAEIEAQVARCPSGALQFVRRATPPEVNGPSR